MRNGGNGLVLVDDDKKMDGDQFVECGCSER